MRVQVEPAKSDAVVPDVTKMKPQQLESYALDLMRRANTARAQMQKGRYEFAIQAPEIHEQVYSRFSTPPPHLLICNQEARLLFHEWDQIMLELQLVLKTVNDISSTNLNDVRTRLLRELMGKPHEKETKLGSGPDCG